MKKILALSLMFVLSLCAVAGMLFASSPVEACATGADEIQSICVLGEAKKEVSPDRASITARIETTSMDIEKAKDENLQIYDRVIQSLVDAGIEKENIVTESFYACPSYDYNCGRTLNGYFATTSFVFKLDNLSLIRNSVDQVLAAGATSINSINYEISNEAELYSEALQEALENAKVKAKELTGQENLQLLSINEEYIYSCSNLYRSYSDGNIDNTLVGKITINAKLKVQFALNNV